MAVGDQVVELVEVGQLNAAVDARVASAISGHAGDNARHVQAGGVGARSNPGVQGELYGLVGATEADHRVQLRWGEAWIDLAVAGWNSLRGRPSAFPAEAHRDSHKVGGGDPLTGLELSQFSAGAKNPIDQTIPALRSLGTASFEAAAGNDARLRTIRDEGTTLAHRRVMDFIGLGVIVEDDPANDRVKITISGAAAGAASESAAGITEQATQAEVEAGAAGNLFATVARLKAELDRRQTPEAWIAPALLNGWVNSGAPFEAVGYRKEPGGIVRLKGAVKSGTAGAAFFTLPAGYRPAGQWSFAVETAGAMTVLNVGVDGTVSTIANTTNNARVSLSGATFAV